MSKLETKQKILIPIIIVALVYIGWQVYDLFFASDGSSSAPVAQEAMPIQPIVKQPDVQKNVEDKTAPTATTVLAPTINPESDAPVKKNVSELIQVPVSTTAHSAEDQKSSVYMQLMQQYQKLQTERILLQEKLAIAETKNQIATLKSKLSALGADSLNLTGINSSLIQKPIAQVSEYKLVYLDKQRGVWTAAINVNGALHEVKAGEKLPDGNQVLWVSSSGVVIGTPTKRLQVSFSGTKPLPKLVVPYVGKRSKITKPKIVKGYKPKLQIEPVRKYQFFVKPALNAEQLMKPEPKTLLPNYSVSQSPDLQLAPIPEKKAVEDNSIPVTIVPKNGTSLTPTEDVAPVKEVAPKDVIVPNSEIVKPISHSQIKLLPNYSVKPVLLKQAYQPHKKSIIKKNTQKTILAKKTKHKKAVRLANKKVKAGKGLQIASRKNNTKMKANLALHKTQSIAAKTQKAVNYSTVAHNSPNTTYTTRPINTLAPNFKIKPIAGYEQKTAGKFSDQKLTEKYKPVLAGHKATVMEQNKNIASMDKFPGGSKKTVVVANQNKILPNYSVKPIVVENQLLKQAADIEKKSATKKPVLHLGAINKRIVNVKPKTVVKQLPPEQPISFSPASNLYVPNRQEQSMLAAESSVAAGQ